MKSFEELLKEKKDLEPNPPKSERAELLGKLYNIYELDYKIQTWKEYCKWLKQNKFNNSKIKVEEYRKIAYPKIQIKNFCSFWLSHIPTEDLYYLISIMNDIKNRKGSPNKWLFWAIKPIQNNKK